MKEDFKIICFVLNELGQTRGLYHALDEISGKVGSFLSKYVYEKENSGIIPRFGQGEGISNKFLLITKEGKPQLKKIITNEDEWDILLVSQDVSISNFPKDFFNNNMLIMPHYGQPNLNDITGLTNVVKKVKPAHHDPSQDEGYFHLKRITDAWDETRDKFDSAKYTHAKVKLINWFALNEKLNKALEFLHCSLGERPPKISILTEGGEKFELAKDIHQKKSLQEWVDNLRGKTGNEYKIALADLRDALLSHSGITRENKVFSNFVVK